MNFRLSQLQSSFPRSSCSVKNGSVDQCHKPDLIKAADVSTRSMPQSGYQGFSIQVLSRLTNRLSRCMFPTEVADNFPGRLGVLKGEFIEIGFEAIRNMASTRATARDGRRRLCSPFLREELVRLMRKERGQRRLQESADSRTRPLS
jgi:hypothetical protein